MKKLLLGALLVGACSPAFASPLGNLYDQVVTDSKFTILENVSPIYYYDAVEKTHQGGFVSSFYKLGNGFVTADAGWVNSIEDSNQKGGALLGGSVHADALARVFFNDTVTYVRSMLPQSSQKFVDAINLGFSFKHNFQRDAFTYGFYSGLEFKY